MKKNLSSFALLASVCSLYIGLSLSPTHSAHAQSLPGASGAPSADAAECTLPFCDIAASLAEFRGLSESRRFSFLELTTSDFLDNTDTATAANIVAFTGPAREFLRSLPNSSDNQRALQQAETLMNQSFEQLAKHSPLSSDQTIPNFRALTSASARYRVLTFWGERIAQTNSSDLVRRLRRFFAAAREICTTAHDEAYILNDAIRQEAASNRRLIELATAEADAIALPFADMNAALRSFEQMGVAERFLLLRTLTQQNASQASSAALLSLLEFSRGVDRILQGSDESQAPVVRQNAIVQAQTIDLLARNPELSAENLITYYRLVGSQAARFQVLQFWGNRIPEITNTNLLRTLVRYFPLALAVSTQAEIHDEAYVAEEATRNTQRANLRIIELSTAPQFVIPIADQAAAVANFRAFDIPQRYLLIQSLISNFADSSDAPTAAEAQALASIVPFANAAKAVVLEAGAEQTFILNQINALISQSHIRLVRSSDLSVSELIASYRALRSGTARIEAVRFWSARIAGLSDRATCQRLVNFFVLARRASFQLEDEEFIPREIQQAEQSTRRRLIELAHQ